MNDNDPTPPMTQGISPGAKPRVRRPTSVLCGIVAVFLVILALIISPPFQQDSLVYSGVDHMVIPSMHGSKIFNDLADVSAKISSREGISGSILESNELQPPREVDLSAPRDVKAEQEADSLDVIVSWNTPISDGNSPLLHHQLI
jgi:hypothetical protein